MFRSFCSLSFNSFSNAVIIDTVRCIEGVLVDRALPLLMRASTRAPTLVLNLTRSWLLGMSFFQALNHALTTVSTGGYSTSDSSMGQFDSPSILLASTVFMAMGAMPFFLFVRFIHGQRQPLIRDQQVRFFLRFLVIVAALLTIYRVLREPVDPFETFVSALFNVTSVVTTTGYASTDYSLWGPFAVVVFLFISSDSIEE